MGGKGGGEIDTSGMTAAMQGQQQISQKELDLANQMFQYGTQRTATYADPLLNEFARIMGYGPTAGRSQVPIPTAGTAPAAAPAPVAGGQAPAGAAGAGTPNMFIDQSTGQLYGGGSVVRDPYGSGWVAPPTGGTGWAGSPGNLPTGIEPVHVVPYGDAQNLGIGASVPWSGTTPTTTAPATTGMVPPGVRYVSPVESSLFQLPVATSQAQLNQTINQIKRTVPPGPQQTAMINTARNQMNQNIGQAAFGTVTQMMNSLLGTSGAAQAGMGQAAGAMQAASAAQAAAGQMAATIANLQMQAQGANNAMLSGIFSSIGQLGGSAMGMMGSMGGGGGGGFASMFGGG